MGEHSDGVVTAVVAGSSRTAVSSKIGKALWVQRHLLDLVRETGRVFSFRKPRLHSSALKDDFCIRRTTDHGGNLVHR